MALQDIGEPPAVLREFEQETGISVQYDTFDSAELSETKLFAGDSGYDVAAPGDSTLPPQIRAGLLQPLDKVRLQNYGNLNPDILIKLQAVDAQNTYAIPNMWGTTGLGMNVETKYDNAFPRYLLIRGTSSLTLKSSGTSRIAESLSWILPRMSRTSP